MNKKKLIWLDDERPALDEDYITCKSVNECKKLIEEIETKNLNIIVIDRDHDLGDYFSVGGDGINYLIGCWKEILYTCSITHYEPCWQRKYAKNNK